MFKKFFKKEDEEELYEKVDPVLEQRRKEKFSTPLIYNDEVEENEPKQDILKEVEMVSDDLYLESGYCISASGVVPVTVGEPTIKVRKILVGGTNE